MSLKIQFDNSLIYQHYAVQQIINCFVGQPISGGIFEMHSQLINSSHKDIGFRNDLVLSPETLLNNIQKVQNGFNESKNHGYNVLNSSSGGIEVINELNNKDYEGILNLSVEMETGTGKTYVYIKTIYELNKLYGFNKFIIIVPSIAIREGVQKSLTITRDHFSSQYDLNTMKVITYDSKKLSSLRDFAMTNDLRIMIMTIDAFNKDNNLFNRPHDKMNGMIPRELVQGACPFVIIDEPQSVDNTITAKNAVKSLNPAAIIRYSATHKEIYNQVYRLSPVDAYDLGLVKKIEVNSVIAETNNNQSFVKLEKILVGKNKHVAQLIIDVEGKKNVERKKVKVSVGEDLYKVSNYRENYHDGRYVNSIDNTPGFENIEFANGVVVMQSQSNDEMHKEVVKTMIKETIREHLDKELRFKDLGVKVLSLIFIDKVKNYRIYNDNGWDLGIYAKIFEEVYNEICLLPKYKNIKKYSATEVHQGYFSQDKKGKIKDTRGDTIDDNYIYNLIMKEKEKLLDINEPLRFIFSHSALSEGWDNPNVFQICTLRDTQSLISKRQEIGRGLRLPVNQLGERIMDGSINTLTVIANESYEDFARSLQKEIEDETGISFAGRIKNTKSKATASVNKQKILTDENFKELRSKIKNKTRYQVQFDTIELIEQASKAINTNLPHIIPPKISSEKAVLDISYKGILTEINNIRTYVTQTTQVDIPDILMRLQSKTFLTRNTLLEILKNSGRLKEILINPQMFMDEVLKIINDQLSTFMVDGIKYVKTGNEYNQMQFEDSEIIGYLNDNLLPSTKSLYDYTLVDSDVESKFAKDLESLESVKFYIKLPSWFTIDTPIGLYNPDRAIVIEDESKIYFIAETKGSIELSDLRKAEQQKIKCGEAHFSVLEGVSFKHVTSVKDIIV